MYKHPVRALRRVIFLCFLAVAAHAQATQVPGPLVDTEWLSKNLKDVVVLDARKDTQSFIRKSGSGEVAGVQACGAKGGGGSVSGHIPDSALAPWGEYAITKKGELHDQLPAKADFEKLMRDSGVNQDSAVVISHLGEGAPNVGFATRLYWTLKYFGHDNVALLDGGMAKWAAEKRKVEYGRTRPKEGDWKATAERRELIATLGDVQKAVADGGQIVDRLPTDFYLGLKLKKGVVAKAGHIPGAKSLPFDVLVGGGPAGATFYPVDQLKQVAAALGVDNGKPLITHCNTGHIATLTWFANSELLGNKQARVYDGSMEEWAKDASRPVSAFVVE